MNRRNFIALLGAAPVAIAAAPAVAEELPELARCAAMLGPQYRPDPNYADHRQVMYFRKDAYVFMWPSLDGVRIVHPDGTQERISINVPATR